MLDMFVVVGIPCWPLHAGYSSPLSTHRHQYSQRRTARYISNGGYDRPCYKESHRRARRICEPGQDGSRRPVLSFVRQQIHATDNLALQHLFEDSQPTFFTASSINRYPSSLTPFANSRPQISAPKPFLMTLRDGVGLGAVTVLVIVIDMLKSILSKCESWCQPGERSRRPYAFLYPAGGR